MDCGRRGGAADNAPLDGSSGMPAPAPGTDPALPAGSRRCQLGAGVAGWDPALPDGPGVAGWDSKVLTQVTHGAHGSPAGRRHGWRRTRSAG